MDISSGVMTVLQSIFAPIPLVWNWVDSVFVLPSVSLLDLLVAAFVLSAVLWLVFGFNGGDDE